MGFKVVNHTIDLKWDFPGLFLHFYFPFLCKLLDFICLVFTTASDDRRQERKRRSMTPFYDQSLFKKVQARDSNGRAQTECHRSAICATNVARYNVWNLPIK